MTNTPSRGFALLVAVLIATVAVTLGVTLLDIAYKQSILASSAKASQAAFYNADSLMECALYYDQKANAFNYDSASPSLSCEGRSVTEYTSTVNPGVNRITSYTLPCAEGGTMGRVTVFNYTTGSTYIYANGYSSCQASDPRRIERGLKVTY